MASHPIPTIIEEMQHDVEVEQIKAALEWIQTKAYIIKEHVRCKRAFIPMVVDKEQWEKITPGLRKLRFRLFTRVEGINHYALAWGENEDIIHDPLFVGNGFTEMTTSTMTSTYT
jgi:hypothetical protein